MKRILMAFMVCAVVAASFGKDNKEKTKVDFYGVDFSAVNVIGAEETTGQFMNAFEQINELLVSEQKKYDVGRFLGLDVLSTGYRQAVLNISKLKDINFKDKKSPEIDLKSIIASYPSSNNKVLLIIAKELNKSRYTGTFLAVIYDGTNKEILSIKSFSGNAGGFGLRNYWAKALFNGLRYTRPIETKSGDDIYK